VFLGASVWIKLAGTFAAPAIAFALPRWRQRAVVALVAVLVASSTFVPAFIADREALATNVIGYRGLVMFTLSSPPTFIWGLKNAFIHWWGFDPRIDTWSEQAKGLPETWPAPCVWLVNQSTWWALGAILVFAFLRRRERGAREIAKSVAGSLAIFYALADALSFQYFAWSMPFWLCAGAAFAWSANLFAGAYLYGVYAFVCDDALLRPTWDFNGHPNWPIHLIWLRELAQWTFVIAGAVWLARAIAAQARARRERA
jgi:hypothetical protein